MSYEECKVPVLAFGRGVTVLGVLRSLAEVGIPTWIAGDPADFVNWSRWYRQPQFGNLPVADPCELEVALERLPFEELVLMPCSDRACVSVASLSARSRRRFHASCPAPEVQKLLADKRVFGNELRRLGVPQPLTVEVDSLSDLEALPEGIFRDVFLKPRDSESFSSHFGVKAFRCKDKPDALEIFRRTDKAGLKMVLQEYVQGPPSAHHFIDGFVDRHGQVRALFARRRLRMNPPDFGNSSCMVSIELDDVAPAIASLKTLLAALSYRGIFSAEFKRDERDGVYKLLEVNARPWWYVGFAHACGVDVCRLAYLDALERDVTEIGQYKVGRICVYPALDLKPCLELRREGKLSLSEWASTWLRGDKPIFQWRDPGPWVRETLRLLPGSLSRLRRRSDGAR